MYANVSAKPWPLLQALVQHKTLRFLNLYTSVNSVPSVEDNGSQTLRFNKASAQHLFLQLRALKQGKPLEKLSINLGEWNRLRYDITEHLHPLDYLRGDLFTCFMDYQCDEVVVKAAREDVQARAAREHIRWPRPTNPFT